MIRLAWALGEELRDRGATAVAITPGWLRSEPMLEHHGVDRGQLARGAGAALLHLRESPRFVGRAIAALAADPDVARWNGPSVSAGELAQVYGFTDVDGTQPDCWRYLVEVQEAGRPADDAGYR